MATFVHLTPESRAARIRRVGIGRLRRPEGHRPGGVFAVPISRDFAATHQWVRELRRRGREPIVGVIFRLPDDEPVWVGRYAQAHQQMTAAEAVARFDRSADCLGWEVIIPRRIEPRAILRVRRLPQVVGWRYFPEAKGKPPRCVERCCTRGDFGAARLRARLGEPDG